jgi:hypothetical protein
MRPVLSILLLACGLASCGSDANRLYGSLSQSYKLDFDRVQIIRVGEDVSVEYQRLSGQNISAKVAKLTVRVGDLANLAGNDVDLTELVGGLPRGTMQRVETSTTDFPLQIGTVKFDQEPAAGTELSGKFHTTLSDPAGRTLNGDFKAKVETR